MRIAIPTEHSGGLNAEVSQHFGHVSQFTIVDIDYDKFKDDNKRIIELSEADVNSVFVVENPLEQHTCFAPVKVLIDNKVDVLVINGIGGRPLMFCLENGIKVYQGGVGKVLDVVRDFLAGFLKPTFQSTCGGH
ncbi:MAG: NifB/NifX family molybdenum-iron cluster-binding protein [Candidatus Helarchaeota archaeon]